MRNVLCSKYKDCLDETIRTRKENFTCEGCKKVDTRAAVTEEEDLRALIFAAAVFWPDLFTQYLKDLLSQKKTI